MAKAAPAPPAGRKIDWPTFSARLDPATFAQLEADLARLKLNRGEWGRRVLTRAAQLLAKAR